MAALLRGYSKLSALRTALTRPAGTDSVPGEVIYMLPSRSCEGMLLDMLQTAGGCFGESPDVWSWAELYVRIVPRAERKRCIDPPDHRLVLEFLLGQTLASLDARGIRAPGGARRRGFVDLLSDAIKEMMLEDVAPDDILRGGDGGRPKRDLLYRLYTDYLLYLDEHGLADSSQIPSLAADAVDRFGTGFMDGRAMRWVGFLSFTGAQLRLVTSLLKRCVFMEFFMPDAGMENLRDAASQLGIKNSRLPSDACRAETMTSADAASQFDMIAAEVALIRGEHMAEVGDDIGILTPPEHVRLMGLALSRRGIPYQPRGEVSVDKTAISHIARLAWDAHRLGWPPKRTLHLLRTPQIAAGELDRDRFTREMPEGAEMWRAFLKDDERARSAFEKLHSFCELMDDEGGHTGEEILRALLELAGDGEWERAVSSEVGRDYDMDSAVREISSARVEIELKLKMLGELSPSLGEAASIRFRGSAAMDFLANWSKEAATALPPRRDGVISLYDSPPPVLVSHSLWIMTDVDPGRYPGPSSDPPLLSGDIRADVNDSPNAAVHLPTMREEREQKEALFRRLAATGEYLTILARSSLDAGGRPQGDSPFLRSLPGEMFSGLSIMRDFAMTGRAEDDDAFQRGGAFPRVAVSKNVAGGRRARVRLSSADEWANCPFSYWCGSIACFSSKPEEEEVFGRMMRGTVMHEAWRSVWTKYVSPPAAGTLRAALLSEWDGIIAGISEEFPVVSDTRSSRSMSELRNNMLSMADWQDDTERRAREAGLRRVRTETEFKLPDLEMENVVFTGRADRVDFWEGDFGTTAVIVDYKLGRGDAYKDSVQLAAYAAALCRAGTDVGGVCYAGHGDLRIRGAWSNGLNVIYGASGRVTEIGEKMEGALETLRAMDDAALTGKYAANYDSKMCRVCGYSSICRRLERGGGCGLEGDGGDE
ncbi:MAG: PD-(D/E)XK nuclease family protein [Synergistaceae bacterium]|jgi:RecB family exonuclease|nr:PD-(D/E)XK nuclease family protein [Synergistaceae bacterium]